MPSEPREVHPAAPPCQLCPAAPPKLLLGATAYEPFVHLRSAGCVFAEMHVRRPVLQGRTEVEQIHKIFKLCIPFTARRRRRVLVVVRVLQQLPDEVGRRAGAADKDAAAAKEKNGKAKEKGKEVAVDPLPPIPLPHPPSDLPAAEEEAPKMEDGAEYLTAEDEKEEASTAVAGGDDEKPVQTTTSCCSSLARRRRTRPDRLHAGGLSPAARRWLLPYPSADAPRWLWRSCPVFANADADRR